MLVVAAERAIEIARAMDEGEDDHACCYIWVDDADAVFAEWEAANTDGTLRAAQDTSYGLREFDYVDRDGNLIRVASDLVR